MSKLLLVGKRLVRQAGGAANIEYALLLGFIALVLIVAAFTLGQVVHGLFDDAKQKVETMDGQSNVQESP